MTNFEKYKDKILSLIENAIPALKDGEIINCNQIQCGECDLYYTEFTCSCAFVKWLYEEADSDNKESEAKEVNNNDKRCGECRHIYKRTNEEPCVSCRNHYILKFEPKLKPCPHCGGKAIEKRTERVYIMCEDCGSFTKTYSTPEEAMEAWNRRV